MPEEKPPITNGKAPPAPTRTGKYKSMNVDDPELIAHAECVKVLKNVTTAQRQRIVGCLFERFRYGAEAVESMPTLAECARAPEDPSNITVTGD